MSQRVDVVADVAERPVVMPGEGRPPLSVVHLLAPAPFGGLETAVVSLATALVAAGQRIAVALVLTPQEPGSHPVAESLVGTGVEVETIVVPTRSYVTERGRVRELLERRRADVLHTHGYRPDVVDAPVARGLRIATVSTVHGYIGGGWKNRAYEWLQNRSLRKCDAVIAVSEPLAKELARSGVAPERIHTVRNGWEPRRPFLDRAEARRRLGLPPTGALVVWIGRMSREKAPDVMMRAAASVNVPDLRFAMIGDGPMRRGCEELAVSLGIADRVSWHGVVPDSASLLPAFDAVALTSWTEGTPMVLLEAMAAGIPVVTTAVGGIPDILDPAEAHLLQAGDAAGLAAAIGDVVARPEAARARGVAAKRRLAADLATEPWAQRHLRIYAGVAPP